MFKTLLLIAIATICVSCEPKDELAGVWERQGNINGGLRVKVKKSDKIAYCEVVESGNNWRFSKGETKWHNIIFIGNGKYELEDLVKGNESEYRKAHMEISADTLRIKWFYENYNEVGSNQKWIRVKTD